MFEHVSVLLAETIAALRPVDGAVFVDCTLGAGGHTEALLDAAACRVVGLDRDPHAIAASTERLARFGDRFTPVRVRFSDLAHVLDDLGHRHVQGIVADLGVSSPQLDEASRGFSFREGGPIDMRMDPDAPVSAADLVNHWPEAELADVIYKFGEEKRSRPIARAIVAGRPWKDTRALADAIARVVGRGTGRIHPATRSFQGLRIAVNDELGEVERLLPQAVDRLAIGGRLAVITFHSLEDRIVKQFVARESGRTLQRDAFGHPIGDVRLKDVRDTAPSDDDPNPRARSARLRTATRC